MDGQIGLVNEDDLLNDDDLKKPDPASLKGNFKVLLHNHTETVDKPLISKNC